MPLILYDGYCGLCNGLVRWLISHDHRREFRFAPLHGQAANESAATIRDTGDNKETILVIANYPAVDGDILDRSGAVLFIAGKLAWPWKGMLVLRVIPRRWLDALYDLVARNRFRFWKRYDECPRPDTDIADRFLMD